MNVRDQSKDYDSVGVLISRMHTPILKADK
jgi:hypothetical protein